MKITKLQAVVATAAYADIFNYPLTIKELETWLIFFKNPPHKLNSFQELKQIKHSNSCFVVGRKLKNPIKAIQNRIGNVQTSRRKMLPAQTAADWISRLPTVRLVGVTGNLAMNNANENDDIDFIIIVERGTLWISRLIITLMMEFMGKRRRPGDEVYKNKICLNMFMDLNALKIPLAEHDLFSAHEVLQMKPLREKDGSYRMFLNANQWVKKFLPNAWIKKNAECLFEKTQGKRMMNDELKQEKPLDAFLIRVLRIFEMPCRIFQIWYMRRRQKNEVIKDNFIRFHPRDARIWIKEELSKRLAVFNIPLDKVFYCR